MANFAEDTIRKLQTIDLRIAQYFVDYCKQNHLLCFFCGGGCIGAIRHKGFIPWDDDLDFFMPREDYERLKNLWKNVDHDPYVLVFPTKEYNDHNIFMTLRDSRTTMIKPYQSDLDIVHGISIDIFPLDGCPSNTMLRKTQLMWALIYQLYCAQIVPENHGKIVSILGKVMLGLIRGKSARYSIWRFAEKQMSKYLIRDCNSITELCAGPRYMRNEYPKAVFASSIEVPFEETHMPIPVGYDEYLRMAFGNYMKLPPERERIASHDCFLDLDRPYTFYKGVKYLQSRKYLLQHEN